MQVMIYGNSLRDFVIGIIVVDPDRLAAHATATGKSATDDSILEEIRPEIIADIKRLADENKLNSLERPK